MHLDAEGNEILCQVHGYPIHEADGQLRRIILYSIDISERKRMQKQFHESQRLESVGRLASGISHDFSNILSAILGYSEMAMFELPPTHPVYEKLERIKEAAEKAASVTAVPMRSRSVREATCIAIRCTDGQTLYPLK